MYFLQEAPVFLNNYKDIDMNICFLIFFVTRPFMLRFQKI